METNRQISGPTTSGDAALAVIALSAQSDTQRAHEDAQTAKVMAEAMQSCIGKLRETSVAISLVESALKVAEGNVGLGDQAHYTVVRPAQVQERITDALLLVKKAQQQARALQARVDTATHAIQVHEPALADVERRIQGVDGIVGRLARGEDVRHLRPRTTPWNGTTRTIKTETTVVGKPFHWS